MTGRWLVLLPSEAKPAIAGIAGEQRTMLQIEAILSVTTGPRWQDSGRINPVLHVANK